MKNPLYRLVEERFKRALVIIFWVYWIFLFVMTSVPGNGVPELAVGDKVEHFGAYLVLAFISVLVIHFKYPRFAWKGRIYFSTFVIFSIYGLFDEIHQFFIPGRFFDWLDFAANVLGILTGLFLAKFLVLGDEGRREVGTNKA